MIPFLSTFCTGGNINPTQHQQQQPENQIQQQKQKQKQKQDNGKKQQGVESIPLQNFSISIEVDNKHAVHV